MSLEMGLQQTHGHSWEYKLFTVELHPITFQPIPGDSRPSTASLRSCWCRNFELPVCGSTIGFRSWRETPFLGKSWNSANSVALSALMSYPNMFVDGRPTF